MSELSILADRAGMAVERLSAAAMGAAVGNFITAALFAGIFIASVVIGHKCRRKADNMDVPIIWIIQGCIMAVCILFMVGTIYDGFMAYLYPEVWVLRKIFGGH